MISKIRKEARNSFVFHLSDVRFELFDKDTNQISGTPATHSELAARQNCPYIINAYGKRMFTDASVARRIFRVLNTKETTFPDAENIDRINNLLKASKAKKVFFVSLIDGVSGKNNEFTEMILMDVTDPRTIRKEKTERSRTEAEELIER